MAEEATKKVKAKEKRHRVLGTARGEGTTYSVLFSTVRQKAGTTHSLVKGRAKTQEKVGK